MPTITLLVLLLAVYTLVRSTFGKEHRRLVVLVSAMVFLMMLNGLPSTAQGIYWANASVFHTWASALLIFLLSIISWNPESGGGQSLRAILGVLICAIIPGLNELAMALLVGILLLRIIILRASNRKESLLTLIWLLVGMGGAIVVSLMPGTSSRMDALPDSMNWGFSFITAAKLSIFLIGLELQQPAFILWSFMMLFFFGQMNHNRLTELIDRIKPKWAIPILSILILFLLYFTSLFSLGGYPPWRVHNTVAISFHILWYFNLFLVSRYRKNDLRLLTNPWFRNLIYLVLFWLLFSDFSLRDPREQVQFRGNAARAWYDLVENAPSYHNALDDRFSTLERADIEDTVSFGALPNQCPTLFFEDISEDPRSLNNAITAYYFKVAAIELDTHKIIVP